MNTGTSLVVSNTPYNAGAHGNFHSNLIKSNFMSVVSNKIKLGLKDVWMANYHIKKEYY